MPGRTSATHETPGSQRLGGRIVGDEQEGLAVRAQRLGHAVDDPHAVHQLEPLGAPAESRRGAAGQDHPGAGHRA